MVALFYFNIGAAAFDQWFNAQQWQHGFEARTTWNLHCTRRDAVGGKADTVSNRYKTNGSRDLTPVPHGKMPRCLSCSTHACSLNVLPYDLHVFMFIARVALSCWRSRKEPGKDILGKEPGKEPGSARGSHPLHVVAAFAKELRRGSGRFLFNVNLISDDLTNL